MQHAQQYGTSTSQPAQLLTHRTMQLDQENQGELSNMTNVTKEQMVTVLEEAVEEYGAKHTAHCIYYDTLEKKPVCIAGVAFVKLGAKPNQMRMIATDVGGLNDYNDPFNKMPDETYGCYTPDALARERVEKILGIQINSDAFVTLAHAQYLQDNGKPWGEALETVLAE